MSAFIVSERTMHRAVHALMPQDAPCAACDELGQQLYRLNAEAVAQRYGKMPDPGGPMIKDKETGRLTDRPARIIDHPEEQSVIERIRQLRAQGNGLRRIAKHLEEAGIQCRGKRWHASTIASILRRNEQGVS